MTNRREFLKTSGAAATVLAAPATWSEVAMAQAMLPSRPIPGTDESLPIIGLGNSSVFTSGDMAASLDVIRAFHERGGAYIDCVLVSRFVVAEVAKQMDAGDDLFLGTYFMDAEESKLREDARRILETTGKEKLDLAHAWPEFGIENWEMFRRWKAEGLTKYIGLSRHQSSYYESMMGVMETDTVDFIQVNYSPFEREAEERILPMAMDRGIAVNINRPFQNGDYFKLVRGHELPEWAAEFNATSWAQFALKFILSHPAVNCVLTETSNPDHALDNISAGFGAMPDMETRERIYAHLKSLQA
jgi:diketogulonate reductase-like aldo/keto reductase